MGVVVEQAQQKDLRGLGGWLVLVGIGTVLSPIRILLTMLSDYPPIFRDGAWEVLTTEGFEAYDPLWAPLLVGEIAINGLLVVAGVWLIYLFFSKHPLFPKAFITLSLFYPVFLLVDAWAFTLIVPEEPLFDAEGRKELFRALINCAVWVPYMLVSKRVKATFIEKRPASAETAGT